MSVKSSPEESADGFALMVVPAAIVILTGWKSPSGFPLASAAEKETVPKSVKGRIPPWAVQHGASAMTSAECFCAPERLSVYRCVQP